MSAELTPFRHRLVNTPARSLAQDRIVIAKRELAAVTHIPGDDSLEEIDRKFYQALRWCRWRSRAERSA